MENNLPYHLRVELARPRSSLKSLIATGSFLSLVMLLLQVGSAGGSYPIELSPKFFQVVHPYMPMTYIVTGLRQTISMTGSIGTQVGVLSAFLVAFMIFGLIIYRQPKTGN